MKKTSLFTGLLSLFLHGMMAQTDFTLPVQTTIETGTIEGKFHTLTGIQTYFGVPFAKAPVGALRWKAPQPAAAWKGVKETKAFGPRPVQAMVFGDIQTHLTVAKPSLLLASLCNSSQLAVLVMSSIHLLSTINAPLSS